MRATKRLNFNRVLRFLAVVFLITQFLSHPTVFIFAQSPTPESSPAAEKIFNEKVKGIRQAVKEKVREKLEKVRKGRKRAFVGKIKEITNSTLILTTRQGEKQAKIADEAKIIGKGRKKIEFKDLEIGNFVIAMGYPENRDILEARRVVVINKPTLSTQEVVFGRVTDISNEEKILTVKKLKKEIVYTIEVTGKTKITKKLEKKVEKVKFSNIEKGDYLVAIGKSSENEEKLISAKIIHIIPRHSPKPTTPPSSPSPTP